ncbi:MAG: shikimate dehydrogenase [Croceitalea sp.]|nr:shikimate dehydrogenase [Croceitalea sp.]
MEKLERKKKKYGLVGKDISYSFSEGYFSNKFKELGFIDHTYKNFDLDTIDGFPQLLKDRNLCGLNVTIPYKEKVMPFLTQIDSMAAEIGAVNTIKLTKDGPKGFNTDAHGFKESLLPLLQEHHKHALILGTGGASKAIAYVLKNLGIRLKFVSRTTKGDNINYSELNKEHIQQYTLIINCTPLGTHPNVDERPNIPYKFLTKDHILFDLIYNPSKTAFLKAGEACGATIQNGLPMLQLQAEKSWEIWNS